MKKRISALVSAMMIVIFTSSLFINTVHVRADESTPPSSTEEIVQSEAAESTPTEGADPTSTPEAGVIEEDSSAPEGESTEGVETVTEILESAPEGVDVVVLDENGEALPLATEEAATIIVAGDPMWCPDGVLPGGAGCTPAYTDFASLIADLTDGGYAGSGTIYVAYDYSAVEGEVVIDHTSGFLADLDDLVIQGGWDFGSNALYNNDPASQSTLNGTWLSIQNWVGDVTVNNLFISNANGIGLSIFTEGDVHLNDVNISGSAQDGADIEAGGDVTVTRSNFTSNGLTGFYDTNNSTYELYEAGNGLNVNAAGDVTLTDIYVGVNAGHGAFVNSRNLFIAGSDFINNGWGNGDGAYRLYSEYYYDFSTIGVTSIYSGESFMTFGGNGLTADVDEDIEIYDSAFDENAGHGASLYAGGDVTISDGSFEENGNFGSFYIEAGTHETTPAYWNYFFTSYNAGSGLIVDAYGDITLSDLAASYNAHDGASIYSEEGNVLINNGSTFSENGWEYGYFDSNEGYDWLEYYLLDSDGDDVAFCEMASDYMYVSFVFNLCEDYGSAFGSEYLEVQAPSFELSTSYYYNYDGSMQADYYLSQYGGYGLDVEADQGTIIVENILAYGNGGDGVFLYGENGVAISDSTFVENGYLGELGVHECLGEGYQYCYDEGVADGAYNAWVNFNYGDGVHADADYGDITISGVGAYHNGDDGGLFHAYDGSVFIEDSSFVGNGEMVLIGDEGLFGEFLSEVYGFGAFELPVSGFDLEISSTSYSEGPDLLWADVDFSSGTGLDVYAYEDITLTNVLAADNLGSGAYAEAGHDLNVFESGFYQNGYGFDGYLFVALEDGFSYISLDVYITNGSGLFGYAGNDLVVDNAEASSNVLHGAELYNGALDSVFVTNSSFNSNGYGGYMGDGGRLSLLVSTNSIENSMNGFMYQTSGSGLYVNSSGNVTLTDVSANGNNLHGVEVINGGNVFVENGFFNGNGSNGYGMRMDMYDGGVTDYSEWTGSGIRISSQGDVTLKNTIANGNYRNGAEINSFGGRVIVSCGQYAGNGFGDDYGYGIEENGSPVLELYGPEIVSNYFGPVDEFYYSNSLLLSEDCLPDEVPVKPQTDTGRCENGKSGTFLVASGDYVVFPCPINDKAFVKALPADQLPAPLPGFTEAGGASIFRSAVKTSLLRGDAYVNLNDKPVLVSFLIPEGVDPTSLSIVYWNGSEWLNLGGSVSDVGPNGEVEEGVQYFQISTSYVGVFVLVSK